MDLLLPLQIQIVTELTANATRSLIIYFNEIKLPDLVAGS